MSTLTKPKTGWEVPSDFSNHSFNLMQMFRLGDKNGTNLSSRPPDFGDNFLHVACGKCCLPKEVISEEVQTGSNASFLSLFGAVNPFDLRTPIKIVGHLRMLQKCGKQGFLAVDGTVCHFICRSKKKGQEEETLKVVSLKYCNNSWIIEETDFTGESHVFEGPCWVHVSIR